MLFRSIEKLHTLHDEWLQNTPNVYTVEYDVDRDSRVNSEYTERIQQLYAHVNAIIDSIQ